MLQQPIMPSPIKKKLIVIRILSFILIFDKNKIVCTQGNVKIYCCRINAKKTQIQTKEMPCDVKVLTFINPIQ